MRVRDSREQNCDLCQDDLLRHLENAREIPRGPIISSIDLPVKIGERAKRRERPRRDEIVHLTVESSKYLAKIKADRDSIATKNDRVSEAYSVSLSDRARPIDTRYNVFAASISPRATMQSWVQAGLLQADARGGICNHRGLRSEGEA